MARPLEHGFVVRFGSNVAFYFQRPKFEFVYHVDRRIYGTKKSNSTVFQATRLADGVRCVIKTVNVEHQSMVEREKQLLMFEREQQLLKTLQHPKIVGLIEIRDDYKDGITIVLESGIDNIGKFATSLRKKDAQQSTKFAIPLACVWTADIVDAIGYIHSLGISHRDMKPDNIVIFQTATGWAAKLLDFGVARRGNGAVKPGAS
ncbi:hypothetical protein FS837_011081 [Tulasnella sp. UAMH 9824]|nr:hypothetical protein FS837_011081 [Tulasnella sp. UAMH 9824]